MISAAGAQIIIRIPIIGGVNDTDQNIEQTARFIADLAGHKKEVHLLPYHSIAKHKYGKLGRPDDFEILHEPSNERIALAISIFNEYGLKVSLGG